MDDTLLINLIDDDTHIIDTNKIEMNTYTDFMSSPGTNDFWKYIRIDNNADIIYNDNCGIMVNNFSKLQINIDMQYIKWKIFSMEITYNIHNYYYNSVLLYKDNKLYLNNVYDYNSNIMCSNIFTSYYNNENTISIIDYRLLYDFVIIIPLLQHLYIQNSYITQIDCSYIKNITTVSLTKMLEVDIYHILDNFNKIHKLILKDMIIFDDDIMITSKYNYDIILYIDNPIYLRYLRLVNLRALIIPSNYDNRISTYIDNFIYESNTSHHIINYV
jgi:hypothetical protein